MSQHPFRARVMGLVISCLSGGRIWPTKVRGNLSTAWERGDRLLLSSRAAQSSEEISDPSRTLRQLRLSEKVTFYISLSTAKLLNGVKGSAGRIKAGEVSLGAAADVPG